MTKNINKIKIVMITILILFEILCIFLMYKTFSNNKRIDIFDNKTNDLPYELAIMIEANTSDGKSMYLESNRNSWPKYGYEYNESISGCLDRYGNKLSGILSFNSITKIATVITDETAYCYLYFDKKENAVDYIIANASDTELWDSTLEDDGYRYVGTNPNNYVCFGYSDVETDCDFTNANNTDKYAYRVIGIFEDDRGIEYVKLIKMTQLLLEKWNDSETENIDWGNNTLYSKLNGYQFLLNTDYITDTNWNNKIANWNYIATNTKTNVEEGINYNFEIAKNIYLHEMNRSSKTSEVGVWNIVPAKIGLMYVSDYMLSLGSGAITYNSYDDRFTLKTSWIHITNNMFDDDRWNAQWEWTMSRRDIVDGKSLVWDISLYGDTSAYETFMTHSVRPVFYLNFDTTMTGDGTIESPFIVNK